MTIKNGDMPAMPIPNGADGRPWMKRDLGMLDQQVFGLSKREQFAMAAMQGIISNPKDVGTHDDKAQWAVKCADALLKALEE